MFVRELFLSAVVSSSCRVYRHTKLWT